MARPFENMRVLDATHVLAGPYCGYQLALMGAETIKIESPTEPDAVRGRGPVEALNSAGLGLTYLAQNSNKKSLSLDLKSEKGREVFLRLAGEADVVIENYRPGAFERMGLGYEAIRRINPDIIYCSITAFGWTGPLRERTGYDPVIQGICGMMAQRDGATGEHVRAGGPVIDYATGLVAAFSIASALLHRERTGEGQRIDCSMLDIALVMMGPAAVATRFPGEKLSLPVEAGTDCYKTKDGYFQLGAFNFRQNRRLWTALGRPEFVDIDSWPQMWAKAGEMRAALSEIMLTRTADEWERFLADIRVPGFRVRTLKETVALEQVAARGFFRELPPLAGVESIRVPGAPFSFQQGGPEITGPPPALGEHNDEILASAGYSQEEIEALKREHVV